MPQGVVKKALCLQQPGCQRSEPSTPNDKIALDLARRYLQSLAALADPVLEAKPYFKRYAAYPRDPFIDTTAKRRRKVREDLEDGQGWAARLWGTLNEPHAYSLHAEHLGLPSRCGDPTNFYCRENVGLWKAAIDARFAKPLRWKLELGERVHIHIIAGKEAGLLHLPHGSEMVKPIYDLKGCSIT